MAVSKILAKNLRKYRADQELTLEDLSEKCGLTVAYISRLEHNKAKKVSLDVVDTLARALGLSLSELAGEMEYLPELDREVILFKETVAKYGGATTVRSLRKSLPSLYEGKVMVDEEERKHLAIPEGQQRKKPGKAA